MVALFYLFIKKLVLPNFFYLINHFTCLSLTRPQYNLAKA